MSQDCLLGVLESGAGATGADPRPVVLDQTQVPFPTGQERGILSLLTPSLCHASSSCHILPCCFLKRALHRAGLTQLPRGVVTRVLPSNNP